MRKNPSYTTSLRPTGLLIFEKYATYIIKWSYTIIWQVRVLQISHKVNSIYLIWIESHHLWYGIFFFKLKCEFTVEIKLLIITYFNWGQESFCDLDFVAHFVVQRSISLLKIFELNSLNLSNHFVKMYEWYRSFKVNLDCIIIHFQPII